MKIKKQQSSGTLLVTQEKGRNIEIDLSASSEQMEVYVEALDNAAADAAATQKIDPAAIAAQNGSNDADEG